MKCLHSNFFILYFLRRGFAISHQKEKGRKLLYESIFALEIYFNWNFFHERTKKNWCDKNYKLLFFSPCEER